MKDRLADARYREKKEFYLFIFFLVVFGYQDAKPASKTQKTITGAGIFARIEFLQRQRYIEFKDG